MSSRAKHTIILCYIKENICSQLNYDKILTHYLECKFYTFLKITMINLNICYRLSCSYIKGKHEQEDS